MAPRPRLRRLTAGVAGAAAVALAWGCEETGPVVGSAQAAASVLTAALASPVPAERAVALDAAGAAGLSQHLEAIRKAAGDPDPWVAAAALRARALLEPEAVGEAMLALSAGPSSAEKLRALALLGPRTPPAVTTEVVQNAAKSDDPVVRTAALERLSLLPAAARRELISHALTDQDEGLRSVGVRAAFRNGMGDPLPALLETLMMGAAERRAEAARTLGEVGEVSAVPALYHAAGDAEGIVGTSATGALCRLGAPGECARLRSAVASRNVAEAGPAIEALAIVGGEVARELLTVAVGHPEPDIRREAAAAVAGVDDPALQRLLLPLLDDERAEPRALAAAALIELEPARALAAVDAAVTSANPALRSRLVTALSQRYRTRGGEHCAEALARLAHLTPVLWNEPLWDAELDTVTEALRTLLTNGSFQARGLAADAALRHPAAELRYLAAHAVATGDVDDPGQALADALADPVSAVRIAAAAARLRLGRSAMMAP